MQKLKAISKLGHRGGLKTYHIPFDALNRLFLFLKNHVDAAGSLCAVRAFVYSQVCLGNGSLQPAGCLDFLVGTNELEIIEQLKVKLYTAK